jgi:hypothetical protein
MYRLRSKSSLGITWTGKDGRQEIGSRAIRNMARSIVGKEPLPQARPDIEGYGILYVYPNGAYDRGLRALRNIARGVLGKEPIIFKRTMVPF